MTEKMEAFCVAYVRTGNAKQAAIEAGYPEKSAKAIGNKTKNKPEVQARIVELTKEIREQREKEYHDNIATAGEIQDFLSRVMRGEEKEEVVLVVGTGEGTSDVETVEKSPALKDRINAAEKLARMQGLFNDKINVEGCVPVVIKDDLIE